MIYNVIYSLLVLIEKLAFFIISLSQVLKLLKLAYEYKFVPPQSKIQKQPLEVFFEESSS